MLALADKARALCYPMTKSLRPTDDGAEEASGFGLWHVEITIETCFHRHTSGPLAFPALRYGKLARGLSCQAMVGYVPYLNYAKGRHGVERFGDGYI
jgi:hypothetical protein